MKLLVVCQYFYPEQFRVSDVCFELRRMGHDVTVLTGLPNYPMGEIFTGYEWDKLAENSDISGSYDKKTDCFIEELNGVRVFRTNLFPRSTGKKNLAKNYLSFARKGAAAAKKMIASGYREFDKILIFQYSPVSMAIPAVSMRKRLLKLYGERIPLLLYCFDLWPESIVSAGLKNHGPVYNAVKAISRRIYQDADEIFVSSKNFEKYFEEKLQISGNLHYLPIYAEEVFSAGDAPDKEDADTEGSSKPLAAASSASAFPCSEGQSSHLNLVFAGNIGEMQSVDTIIYAAAEIEKQRASNPAIPKVCFHIVGDGSAFDKVIRLASDLGLASIVSGELVSKNLHIESPTAVFFHGRHPLAEMPHFYSLADGFLVTLKKDPFISYTLPGKIQSYMAAGKPILAAIDGETAEVIQNSQCGICCGAEDSDALAAAILDFARDKEKRRVYGTNAKDYYKQFFSKESFFHSLLKLLE